jgi:hypothetical protein
MTANHHTIFIDTCPGCNGDGGWESTPHNYNPVTGQPITHWIGCNYCGGSGEVETEYECRTLDEVEAEHDEMLAAGTHYVDASGNTKQKPA